jgi:hypothetical protein
LSNPTNSSDRASRKLRMMVLITGYTRKMATKTKAGPTNT